MPLFYLIAGEQSGDAIGARLMRAIRRRQPDARFAGIGGDAMHQAGLQSLFPLRELAVMGLLEVLPRIARLRRLLRRAVADIRARAPDVLVTIDSPGFTLRVLRALSPTALPRVHYVAPQVWAWREHRVRGFPGLWDELLCLLPFEPVFFAKHGLPARFVGHPVLESGADQGDAARFRARFGIAPDARVVTLMPGSRRTEASRLLPILRATLDRLPEPVLPVIPLAPPVEAIVRRHTAGWLVQPVLLSGTADKYDAFAASAAALTKSGTSTLELALAKVPMLVTYRVNPVSFQIAKRLVKVRHASILNLLADRPAVPELLQNDGSPDRLAAGLHRLLSDPTAGMAQREMVAEALALLRPANGTPSDQAADIVLSVMAGGAARLPHPAARGEAGAAPLSATPPR